MTTKLEDIDNECWRKGIRCIPCSRIAAVLIQQARAERDAALLDARLGHAEARRRNAEADHNADIASRMEKERDEALDRAEHAEKVIDGCYERFAILNAEIATLEAELQRYRDDARFSTADALKQKVRAQEAELTELRFVLEGLQK